MRRLTAKIRADRESPNDPFSIELETLRSWGDDVWREAFAMIEPILIAIDDSHETRWVVTVRIGTKEMTRTIGVRQ